MNSDQANEFDATENLMKGMYEEIGLLSKKKPDGALNKFKINHINQILSKANSFLFENYTPLPGFQNFNDDELPTASDVAFVLSQYLKSMDKFRFDNVVYEAGKWYWKLDDRKTLWKQTKRSNFLVNE